MGKDYAQRQITNKFNDDIFLQSDEFLESCGHGVLKLKKIKCILFFRISDKPYFWLQIFILLLK